MGLYNVSAYDSVQGNRNLKIVVDNTMYNADTIVPVRTVYEARYHSMDMHEETRNAIEVVNGILGSDIWRYIPFYYPNRNDIPYLSDLHARIFQIFRESHTRAFSTVSPYDISDDVTINGVTTNLREHALISTTSQGTTFTFNGINNEYDPSHFYPFQQAMSSRYNDRTQTSNQDVVLDIGINFYLFNDDIFAQTGKWNFNNDTLYNRISITFRYYIDNNEVHTDYGECYLFECMLGINGPSNYKNFVGNTIFNETVTLFNEKNPEPYDIPTDPYIDPEPDPDDPFTPSDEDGGRDGEDQNNWGKDSEPNPVPGLPSISVVDTGFITLFNPTVAKLKELANYMWGGLFDVSTWKKIMADPMDAILGLLIVPVNVTATNDAEVKVGNIGTGIRMNKADAQYYEFDCGTIQLSELWKSYLDYSPYTKLSIYLPYIGSQELDIDIMQTNAIGVKYHIDVLTGACVAFVTADGNVVSQFSGQCAVSIPITSKDLTQTIMSLCTLVASGIGVVASGGMSAPVQAGMIAGAATAAANTAANVVSSKPVFSKSGNMSGSNGLLSMQRPYIILEQPKQCVPMNQNKYTGYPSYITKQLGSISGFTQVQDIHLDGIPCTREERDEILEQLRTGVIL